MTTPPGQLGSLWLASGGTYVDPNTGRRFQHCNGGTWAGTTAGEIREMVGKGAGK